MNGGSACCDLCEATSGARKESEHVYCHYFLSPLASSTLPQAATRMSGAASAPGLGFFRASNANAPDITPVPADAPRARKTTFAGLQGKNFLRLHVGQNFDFASFFDPSPPSHKLPVGFLTDLTTRSSAEDPSSTVSVQIRMRLSFFLGRWRTLNRTRLLRVLRRSSRSGDGEW